MVNYSNYICLFIYFRGIIALVPTIFLFYRIVKKFPFRTIIMYNESIQMCNEQKKCITITNKSPWTTWKKRQEKTYCVNGFMFIFFYFMCMLYICFTDWIEVSSTWPSLRSAGHLGLTFCIVGTLKYIENWLLNIYPNRLPSNLFFCFWNNKKETAVQLWKQAYISCIMICDMLISSKRLTPKIIILSI